MAMHDGYLRARAAPVRFGRYRFIGQNVYLYCSSEGLATVFRGAVDYASLEKTLELPTGQFVTFAQTVGYPRA
jgi:nitroreductase